MVINTCSSLLNTSNINTDLVNYLSSDLINELYFKPKNISIDKINNKINDIDYISKVNNTINYYKNIDLENVISQKISEFEEDINYKLNNYKIYVIIGLDTSTIYSIKYNGEDVTVLLLESTNGDNDYLNMLLAHEFTHFVRREVFKRDIFENSIGERFIVEGIGCNYSREIVTGKDDYKYCIVGKDVFEWVKNNINKLEEFMKGKLDSNELMKVYFSMYIDTLKTGLPARCGYVYGYLIVKEYLEKNNLKVKDIITKEWFDLI